MLCGLNIFLNWSKKFHYLFCKVIIIKLKNVLLFLKYLLGLYFYKYRNIFIKHILLRTYYDNKLLIRNLNH